MLRPDIEKRDPNAEFSLGNITFSNPTLLVSQFHLALNEARSRYEASELRNGIDTLHLGKFNYIDLLKDDPILTPDEIQDMKSDRPGLFIPQNTPSKIGQALIRRYDDNLLFNFIANHPTPGILSKLAAFGGATSATLLDPGALVGGGVGARLATKGLPAASRFMETVGLKSIAGSNTSRVASKITQSAVIGSAVGGGMQFVTELGEENRLRQEGEPSAWIQSAMNVGEAIGLGTLIGGGLGSLGILAQRSFDHISPKVKEVIGRYYSPVTKDADITAREDAAGQGYNGQTPDVVNTLRQGAIDAGQTLRDRLQAEGININELNEALNFASEDLMRKIQDVSTSQYIKDIQQRIREERGIVEGDIPKDIKESAKKERNKIIEDLGKQQLLVKSLQDQITDSHIPLNRSDMKVYSDYLQSIGIPEIKYELPSEKEFSIQERLNDFEESEVKELMNKPGFTEMKNEYESILNKKENQPSFSKMVKEMVNCILKGVF